MPAIDPNTLGMTYSPFTSFPNGISNMGFPLGRASYTLTAAQLLVLQTTPVLIVPPANAAQGFIPGLGLVIVVERMILWYHFGGTAFTVVGTTNFQLEYVGKTTALATASATGLADQAANTWVSVGAAAAGNISQANSANLGIEVKLAGTTPQLTLGTGTVTVDVFYTIIPVI